MEDGVARPAEDTLLWAVSEAARVQGLGAVCAGEAGGVIVAGPGEDPLRLIGHGATLEAALGTLHWPPFIRVQVEILGDKVSLDKAGFTIDLV